jgi:4-hydroxy-3-methylbut-2-en-1-yl diphosphate reductase
MLVEVDKRSGFCFGVQNAVEIAEECLSRGEKVYSLGPIVHNDKEMERLRSLGLVTIDHEQFRQIKNCNVLIRAHGEPPETYITAVENNIRIIEATCPIVRKLQSRIREDWINLKERNGQVVIYGKKGHAEVIGLLGQTENEGILITEPADINRIDTTRPVTLFSQTTMDIVEYDNIKDLIFNRMKKEGVMDPVKDLVVKNTLCGQVSNRVSHLKTFAAKHDTIIFVSGKESSNGRMLFSVCKSVNPDSHFVSSPEEIDITWFDGKKSAGICGATSTPRWLIEKIRDIVSNI